MGVMMRLAVEQYTKMPMLANDRTCSGKTYIVTGSNSGLGLETVKHLVEFKAAHVILAVRNLTSGGKAKTDIEKLYGRTGVVQVWHIDMASNASVQAFAKKASEELERIDGVVLNAGIFVDSWALAEGMESTVQVNVVNTLFLGALLMPKLSENARKFGIHPSLVFIVSVLGYTVKAEMDKNRHGTILDNLNDQKKADMDARYALSKLVKECAVRQFAALCPVEKTGVIVNMVAPGLCSTGLGRDARTLVKMMHGAARAMMARTAEEGSRTILHGLIEGIDSHGKLLSGCKIKEYWVPEWLSNDEGQSLQKAIWNELAEKLEKTQPGCISQLP